MLGLKVRRRSPIYRLGAKGYMDSVQHARAGAGKAGRLGIGPDVRWLARRRMSGLRSRMSGMAQTAVLLSGWVMPDVRLEGPDVWCFRKGRMSGGEAGCPGCQDQVLCFRDTLSGYPGGRSDFR